MRFIIKLLFLPVALVFVLIAAIFDCAKEM